MISIEDLEKELKAGNLCSIYLLYGEELFLLETSLNKIKKIFGECVKGINYILIDDTNLNQLVSKRGKEKKSRACENKRKISRLYKRKYKNN